MAGEADGAPDESNCPPDVSSLPNCGEHGICRESGPPQAENPTKQDSLFFALNNKPSRAGITYFFHWFL